MENFNQVLISYKEFAQKIEPSTTAMQKVRAIKEIIDSLPDQEGFKRVFTEAVFNQIKK